MHPRFVTAFLKSSGEAGIVMMEQEGAYRVVVADREALQKLSDPPRADETRLQDSLNVICEIASTKILLNSSGPFSTIRLSGDDIDLWHAHRDNRLH